jgi:hypothetical protein
MVSALALAGLSLPATAANPFAPRPALHPAHPRWCSMPLETLHLVMVALYGMTGCRSALAGVVRARFRAQFERMLGRIGWRGERRARGLLRWSGPAQRLGLRGCAGQLTRMGHGLSGPRRRHTWAKNLAWCWRCAPTRPRYVQRTRAAHLFSAQLLRYARTVLCKHWDWYCWRSIASTRTD